MFACVCETLHQIHAVNPGEYCGSLVWNLLLVGRLGVCGGIRGDIAAIEDSNTKHCCGTTGTRHAHKYMSVKSSRALYTMVSFLLPREQSMRMSFLDFLGELEDVDDEDEDEDEDDVEVVEGVGLGGSWL